MIKKTAALLLAASLVLSACGQDKDNNVQSPAKEAGNESVENQPPSAPSETPNNTEPDTPVQNPTNPEHSEKPNDASQDKENDNAEGQQDPSSDKVSTEPQYYMNKVYNIVPNDESVEKKVVLLTFDDGPKDEGMINELIDVLDKHEAKAIFFVNGYRVKQNPELLKLIHNRGQIIGNHSWDHIDLRKESKQSAKKQIEDVQKIVMDTIGEKPKFFRPPFGSGGDYVKQVTKDNNLLFMTWSNGSLDWESQNKNKPEAVVNNVMEQLHPGSNILMHELPWTVEALDSLLTKLEKKGYGFVDPENIELKMK